MLGFKCAQSKAIMCLQSGSYILEDRKDIQTKNRLATGEITVDQVIALLMACKGNEYEERQHDSCSFIRVHIFRTKGWYVKLYFLDPNCYVISVHLIKGANS